MLTQNQTGILYMVLSTVAFSLMDILVKLMSPYYPTGELVFCRGFFGLIPIFFIIPRHKYKNFFETKKLKLHLIRAAAGAFAMISIYFGIRYLPLAEAVSITFAAPVFVTILSIFFLQEKVRFIRWSAIALGLAGVLVVLKPGTELFSIYSIFPIFFCLGFSIVAISIKKLSATEPDYLIMIFFTFALIVYGFLSILNQDWIMPTMKDLVFLVLIGISGSVGNMMLTMSIRRSNVSSVTPIKYLSLVFAIISGMLLFNELPSTSTYIGAGMIILSSLIIFRREQGKKITTTITRQI